MLVSICWRFFGLRKFTDKYERCRSWSESRGDYDICYHICDERSGYYNDCGSESGDDCYDSCHSLSGSSYACCGSGERWAHRSNGRWVVGSSRS